MKYVTYHLPTKLWTNVSTGLVKGLQNTRKMILNILEPSTLWPDNSLLKFPF